MDIKEAIKYIAFDVAVNFNVSDFKKYNDAIICMRNFVRKEYNSKEKAYKDGYNKGYNDGHKGKPYRH